MLPQNFRARHKKLLLVALFFSLIGDVLLDYKAGGMDSFALGMVSFAIAQITYVITFGFEPLKPIIGAIFYLVGGSSKRLNYYTQCLSLTNSGFIPLSIFFFSYHDGL